MPGVVGATTAVGGAASALSGGDWFTGAMQGMNIGLFNHGWKKQSDGQWAYELDGVTVVGKRPNSLLGLIVVKRFAESANATISTFSARGSNGQSIKGYFLEPEGPATIKSGFDKRIPAGEYNMDWTYSNRFKSKRYLITNPEVPASRGIRMHTGNYYYDTEGCFLPGNSYSIMNGDYYVIGSKKTYTDLIRLLDTNRTKLIINNIP